MTTPARLERELPAILGDLAMGPIPDYIDDVFVQTGRMRQRPAWTSPERWLPMADITSRQAFAPRVPLRVLGVALVIIALLVAGVLVVGSRQTKLPPPFGPAKNGLVTYAANGDIYTVDPASGVATAVVAGPEIDASPEYSLDGTRIDFVRRHDVGAQTAFDLIVANADGSDPHVISTEPLDADATTTWTADGSAVLVGNQGKVVRYDVTGRGPSTVVIPAARFVPGEIRPPDGAQIVFENDETEAIDLWIANIDGTDARVLLPETALLGKQGDLAEVRWSPDGRLIAFTCAPLDGSDGLRICLMNADGSNLHPLTAEPGAWVESDLRWSPDGRSVAFNRWRHDPATGAWEIRPIGIAPVVGGPVVGVGPAPASEGALFDWSPDGTVLLSLPARFAGSPNPDAAPAKPLAIDVATGKASEMGWTVNSDVSWQRTAD